MLIKLALGTGMIVLNLSIQIASINWVITFLNRREQQQSGPFTRRMYNRMLYYIMSFLFIGHILQFATWAILFVWLGEFDGEANPFETAFYHSTVNFTSLGYGDIVMSEQWRLLGALEAANGVLMFGLTAGLILSVMTAMMKEGEVMQDIKSKLGNQD